MAYRNYCGNYDLVCAPEDLQDGTLALQPAPTANPVCLESRWVVVRVYDKGGYIVTAWKYAFEYDTDEAIIRHTSQDFYEILKGLLPFLEQAILLAAATTAAGAGAGAAGGSLLFGIGAVPGAVFGAEVGLEAAGIILNVLGVGYLLIYIKDHLVEMGDPLMKGTRMAIDSCGLPGELKAAGRLLADGFGVFASLLLQAAAAYVLHEGFKAGREKLGHSQLGEPFAKYASRMARRDYCLERLALANEPYLVKSRVQMVVDFIEDEHTKAQLPEMPLDEIVKILRGIDLNSEVKAIDLEPGRELVQRVHRDGVGPWYSDRGYAAKDLGIDSTGRTYNPDFIVQRTVKALKSRSKSIEDKFSNPKTKPVTIIPKTLSGEPTGEAPKTLQSRIGVPVSGGGQQYYVTDWKRAIKEKPRR
jgi:hypothetical protein